jgi:hypothetical protein
MKKESSEITLKFCHVRAYNFKIILAIMNACHVKWVHCQHGMAHPRFADRGDGLQIWRVAVNILNKQS